MVRQTVSLQRSLLGTSGDFPLMSHVLLNWKKKSTIYRRGGLIMVVRFMDWEGVLAADATTHYDTLICHQQGRIQDPQP